MRLRKLKGFCQINWSKLNTNTISRWVQSYVIDGEIKIRHILLFSFQFLMMKTGMKTDI